MSNVSDGSGRVFRVLVTQYSQTGQLTAVVDQILAPLRADPRVVVHVETLTPAVPFPFPWPFFRFLDAFPESALLIPPALAPLSLTGHERFDLVILPYQVWFLAPSQPVAAFLTHPAAQQILKGTSVVTVIVCRNMWLSAQEKVKSLLDRAGAHLIDNVVLTDPSPALATFITTPRWLLSGKKTAFWGLPAPGVSDTQIRETRRFGLAICDGLEQRGHALAGQPLLAGLEAVNVDPRLYFSERTGVRSFRIWGTLVRGGGAPGNWKRLPLLTLYVVFLVLMIVTLVPLSLALQACLRPFLKGTLAKIKARFEHPSGSSSERRHLYDT